MESPSFTERTHWKGYPLSCVGPFLHRKKNVWTKVVPFFFFFFFFPFFFNDLKKKKKVLYPYVIINSARLNHITLGCVRTIHIVLQHFCKTHDSNQITFKPVSMTQSKTPSNKPRFMVPLVTEAKA